MEAVFLRATAIIDHDQPMVAAQARALAKGQNEATAIARACFLFVRDRIRHSVDHRMNPVTLRASDVLAHQTGYCFAKSHLLAALLRANGIPAGLCYQRLSIDDVGPPFTLHGFNAVHLPAYGWFRIDARGNKPGIATDFDPPRVTLAYTPTLPGEATLADIVADPWPEVVACLTAAATWEDVMANLPDWPAPSPPSISAASPATNALV